MAKGRQLGPVSKSYGVLNASRKVNTSVPTAVADRLRAAALSLGVRQSWIVSRGIQRELRSLERLGEERYRATLEGDK